MAESLGSLGEPLKEPLKEPIDPVEEPIGAEYPSPKKVHLFNYGGNI